MKEPQGFNITGTLQEWYLQTIGNAIIVWGFIYGDVKQRWCDGTYIHTSAVINTEDIKEGGIIRTLNSVYKLGEPRVK